MRILGLDRERLDRGTSTARAEGYAAILNMNSMSEDGEGFIMAFRSEHRTLQQKMATVFLRCLAEMAKDYEDGNYDARNEAACRKAHICMVALDGEGEVLSAPFI